MQEKGTEQLAGLAIRNSLACVGVIVGQARGSAGKGEQMYLFGPFYLNHTEPFQVIVDHPRRYTPRVVHGN
jgi:hypothetical protein